METSIILSATIAIAAGIGCVSVLLRVFLRIKNSKKVTFTKKDETKITVPTTYNRVDSKRFIEFIDGGKFKSPYSQ